MASNASKSPTGNGGLRRKTVTQEKKIADDEFMAAAIGDVEWLKQSIRAHRGAVTFDKNGLAPIHLAAIHGRVDCLRLLVEKFKVDVNLGSTTGWRPAHLCISNQTGKRAYQCLAYLMEKQGDPSMANEDGITPMHQAASEGHVQCLKALIDAGGKVTGKDARGHTPLDLAKLWGHRKCARLLATERWQQDKGHMEVEMKQLQKIRLQQTLTEITEDEEHKDHQAFYGEKAFKEWLDTRELNNGNNGPPRSKPREVKPVVQKPKPKPQEESLYKANSIQQPSIKQNTSNQAPQVQKRMVISPTNDDFDNAFDSSTQAESAKTRTQTEPPEQSEAATQNLNANEGLWYNPHNWVKSTKLPVKSYTPILPDHYPHDEYTMKQKHPPKRQRSKNAPRSDPSSSIQMPQLPKDVIEKNLNPDMYERAVVYKCKHIDDVHKKHHVDNDKLPRQEAGLHMMDDLRSMVFKAGLQIKAPASSAPKGELPHWLAADGMLKNSAMTLEKLDPKVINTYKRLSKPQSYPHINGPEYVLSFQG